MPDEHGNATQEDINTAFEKLNKGISLFTSQVTAQADKAKNERVNGIVELAVKAGKDKEYTVEKLTTMSPETLEIVENSLNDLIKAMDDNQDNGNDAGGQFNDRGNNTPDQVSNYKLIDGMADMICHAWGVGILNDEEKEEVRIEHIAARLPY